MAKIYLIRHAESIANTKGIYQGQTHDTGLSLLGRKQARALVKAFRQIKFDIVFSSPLKRSLETAQNISEKIVVEKDIIETNHGLWEGLSKNEVSARWPKIYKNWNKTPSEVQFPEGEKFTDTAKRASRWFKELIKKDGTFAVVTHINIIQSILCKISGLSLNRIWDFNLQPTSVTLIQSHSLAKIVFINKTDHLEKLLSDLGKEAL